VIFFDYFFLFLLSLKASPVAKCQNLTLGGSVRVSPSHCLTSNQDYGSTCSFSCAHGYQVSGPSSSRCGIVGAWSEDENTVDCSGLYLVYLLPSTAVPFSSKNRNSRYKVLWNGLFPPSPCSIHTHTHTHTHTHARTHTHTHTLGGLILSNHNAKGAFYTKNIANNHSFVTSMMAMNRN